MDTHRNSVRLAKAFYIIEYQQELRNVIANQSKTEDEPNFEVVDFLTVCTFVCKYKMWDEHFINLPIFKLFFSTMNTGDEFFDSVMKQGFVEALLHIYCETYPLLENDLIIAAKAYTFGEAFVNATMLRKQMEIKAVEKALNDEKSKHQLHMETQGKKRIKQLVKEIVEAVLFKAKITDKKSIEAVIEETKKKLDALENRLIRSSQIKHEEENENLQRSPRKRLRKEHDSDGTIVWKDSKHYLFKPNEVQKDEDLQKEKPCTLSRDKVAAKDLQTSKTSSSVSFAPPTKPKLEPLTKCDCDTMNTCDLNSNHNQILPGWVQQLRQLNLSAKQIESQNPSQMSNSKQQTVNCEKGKNNETEEGIDVLDTPHNQILVTEDDTAKSDFDKKAKPLKTCEITDPNSETPSSKSKNSQDTNCIWCQTEGTNCVLCKEG